ncbi:autotransporter outer membrane beta-barrel domain-containing protein [Parabacteroides sp. FAFU027]|uniref:autotransporter outer membrane beta-barrel domain-containing protein n=1 Tax=Parabacteroides sp. FAFU027 TaxID=2922715 RepID=UPI001FAED5FC|nr:autotransporter outer membrane beta-barrel domain-containing protein [Parabacteroides sp. FAFU027]
MISKHSAIYSLLILTFLLTTGCAHQIVRSGYTVNKSEYRNCTIEIKKNVIKTDNLTQLGIIKLGDSGFSLSCSEDEAIKILKKEGCALNADLINITEEKHPDLWSSCYRCTAVFYKYKTDTTTPLKTATKDTILKAPIKDVVQESIQNHQKPGLSKSAVFNKFTLGTNLGFAQRLAPLPKDISAIQKDFYSTLKRGLLYSLDATYFFNEQYGIGIKHAGFNSSNSLDNVSMSLNNYTTYGKLKEETTISFTGPILTFTSMRRPMMGYFSMSAGLGYLKYTEGITILNNNTEKASLNGSTLGTYVDLGYYFPLSEYFYLGAQASLIQGALYSEKQTDFKGFTKTIKFENSDFENLTHLDLSVGLRYCW